VAGRQLPLFAVLGGLGTFLAFVTVTGLHIAVAAAGTGWLLIGIGVYVIYRRRQGLDLTSTVKIVIAGPAVDTEAEYDAVLVAFQEGGYVPEVMATAARLAARKRRGIHVLVTIPVPATSPIDVVLPEQEASAQSIIEEAKVQVGRRVSGHWEKVRAGQTGRRIVDEARSMRAEAIVMPMARGNTGFARALETVLRERRCRVIIQSSPGVEARRAPVTV
jgi:APA family basic amino acid/polyamine antiporter